MPNQGQQGDRDRDREGNLGQSDNDKNRPTGTSGQQPGRGGQSGRENQQNLDEEDTGMGNRTTNR